MAKLNDAPESSEAPAKPAVTVYPFRIKGTDRVYEIDKAHLEGFRSRKDAEYIGTIPLPPRQNEKPK